MERDNRQREHRTVLPDLTTWHSERLIRVGLVPKLVISALLLLVLLIFALLAAINSTFETDLSVYLQRVETEQVAPIAQLLGEEYARTGNWAFLFASRERWPQLVAQVLDKKVPASGQLKDMSLDVIGMLPRLSIRDAGGMMVMQRRLPPRPESVAKEVTLPIMVNGKQVGDLLMLPTPIPVNGLDHQFRHDQLHAFYLTALPALIVVLLIAIPLGYHFVKPVQRLAQGIHRLAGGDYGVRLAEERQDELGKLAGDFNHLANVLQRSEAQRREGMASVSHELRTPIATMIASVEAMQDGIRPLNAEQLERLSGTMEHLNTLVDDLYELALADVGKLVCQRDPLEWGRVIEESVHAMRNKLEGKGLKLECELEQGVTVNGDAQRLRQVVTNLLENCYRYSEQNGTVWIRLQQDKDKAVMTISDSGPGVGSEYFDSLFVRFSRNDASRSREYGGAGLGLALVKAIAEAHQGSVEAFNSEKGGLGIRISLPLG